MEVTQRTPVMMDSPFWRPLWRTRGSRIQPSLPGASHGSLGFYFYFFVRKAMLKLFFCNSCQPLCAVDPTAPGAGSRPGPTACNALFFGISMHSLIQRVLLLIGSIAASELWRCTAH